MNYQGNCSRSTAIISVIRMHYVFCWQKNYFVMGQRTPFTHFNNQHTQASKRKSILNLSHHFTISPKSTRPTRKILIKV